MPQSAPPVVHPFPKDDSAFTTAVADALRRTNGGDVGEALVAMLRAAYPSVVARRRDPLASLPSDPTEVWYVYRDGAVQRR